MKRRSFFSSLARAAAIVGLAPYAAFNQTPTGAGGVPGVWYNTADAKLYVWSEDAGKWMRFSDDGSDPVLVNRPAGRGRRFVLLQGW